MIVDSHAHVVMPSELYQYMGELVASRANPAGKFSGVSRESIDEVASRLISVMDGVGTDIQFLSPRPYMMLHSLKPARVGAMWTRAVKRCDLRQVQAVPESLSRRSRIATV